MKKSDAPQDWDQLLSQAYELINSQQGTQKLTQDQIKAALETIILLGHQNNNFEHRLDQIQTSIDAALSLDFTNKTKIAKEDSNLFTFTANSINLLIEKMEHEMVSQNALNSIMSQFQKYAIITSEAGKIRFLSPFFEKSSKLKVNRHSIRDLIADFDALSLDQMIKFGLETKVNFLAKFEGLYPEMNMQVMKPNKNTGEIQELLFVFSPIMKSNISEETRQIELDTELTARSLPSKSSYLSQTDIYHLLFELRERVRKNNPNKNIRIAISDNLQVVWNCNEVLMRNILQSLLDIISSQLQGKLAPSIHIGINVVRLPEVLEIIIEDNREISSHSKYANLWKTHIEVIGKYCEQIQGSMSYQVSESGITTTLSVPNLPIK